MNKSMTPTKQRALITGLIVLGILIAGFFGIRSILAFREFRRHGPPPHFAEALTAQPMETDVELIREWMTIPYVSMTYHVHPKVIFNAVRIDPKGNDNKSIEQLNHEFFPNSPGFVLTTIKTAILSNQPPTPPAAP